MHSNSQHPTGEGSQDLSRQFQQAAEHVSSLDPATATPEMHTLYGLYKQATSGDHDTYEGEVGREEHDNPDGPVGLSQAQWEAWSQFKGMSKEEAMRRYVAEAGKLGGGAESRPGGRGASSWTEQVTRSSQAQPTGEEPTNRPAAGEGSGTEAGAMNAGLQGDLRSGAQYGSEEERKDPGLNEQQGPR